MKCLGITGGIGSGKSYIADLLRNELGVPVYDCDSRAKALIEEDRLTRQELTSLLGPGVYRDGHLDKAFLSAYVFENEKQAAQVNAIVHPAVLRDFGRWYGTHRQEGKVGLVGMETALLYESGFHEHVDKVLFVRASEELRIRRAMNRNGAPRKDVERRISLQHAQDFESQADYVIDNEDASREELLRRLEQIVRDMDETRPPREWEDRQPQGCNNRERIIKQKQ